MTEEYAAVAGELAAALARKRPSPLVQGRAPTWACGITYALGTANFLFDRTQTPYINGRDLCALFSVSQSAGSAKARDIMRLLHIVPLDPRWCLPSKLADNPAGLDDRGEPHRHRRPDDAARVSRRGAPSRPDSVYMYDGASHGFNNDTTPRYDEKAATLAWARTVEFLHANLRK